MNLGSGRTRLGIRTGGIGRTAEYLLEPSANSTPHSILRPERRHREQAREAAVLAEAWIHGGRDLDLEALDGGLDLDLERP